jgi:hypothetical protein
MAFVSLQHRNIANAGGRECQCLRELQVLGLDHGIQLANDGATLVSSFCDPHHELVQ